MIIRIFTLADSAVARLQWDHGVTIVTDTANQSESCRIAVSQYIMLAGEDTGEGGGSGLLDYWCNGGGRFRVTADPLLFIYSVSRLFVQT